VYIRNFKRREREKHIDDVRIAFVSIGESSGGKEREVRSGILYSLLAQTAFRMQGDCNGFKLQRHCRPNTDFRMS
jgi:hypothetical protein